MTTRKSGVAYSMDLRERVLALYDDGLKTKAVAERLKVCPAWARRIKQWRREGKSIAPKPLGSSKPKLDEQLWGSQSAITVMSPPKQPAS